MATKSSRGRAVVAPPPSATPPPQLDGRRSSRGRAGHPDRCRPATSTTEPRRPRLAQSSLWPPPDPPLPSPAPPDCEESSGGIMGSEVAGGSEPVVGSVIG